MNFWRGWACTAARSWRHSSSVAGERDLLQDVAAGIERGHRVLAVQRDRGGDEDYIQPLRQHLVVCAAQMGLGEEGPELFEGGWADVATGDDAAVGHEVEDARRAKTAAQPDNAYTITTHSETPFKNEEKVKGREEESPFPFSLPAGGGLTQTRGAVDAAGRSPSSLARRWG